MKSKILSIALMLLLMFTVISCAPSNGGDEFGFLGGLWHGVIFPFSLVGKILSGVLYVLNNHWGDWNIGLYADKTSGGYWFGYIIGLVCYGIPMLKGHQ